MISVWYNEDFNRLGILNDEGIQTFHYTLFEFETEAYNIVTKETWLEEDGWEMIVEL